MSHFKNAAKTLLNKAITFNNNYLKRQQAIIDYFVKYDFKHRPEAINGQLHLEVHEKNSSVSLWINFAKEGCQLTIKSHLPDGYKDERGTTVLWGTKSTMMINTEIEQFFLTQLVEIGQQFND